MTVDATSPAATPAQQLCCALAGVDGISSRFAESALDQARRRFGPGPVDELLAAFQVGGLAAVRDHPQQGAARALAYLLYTGGLPDGQIDHEADYFESVVWRVIQAHPRGLSGGYFGHWHYPPEDSDGRLRLDGRP